MQFWYQRFTGLYQLLGGKEPVKEAASKFEDIVVDPHGHGFADAVRPEPDDLVAGLGAVCCLHELANLFYSQAVGFAACESTHFEVIKGDKFLHGGELGLGGGFNDKMKAYQS